MPVLTAHISQKTKDAMKVAVRQAAAKILDEQSQVYAKALADIEMRELKRIAIYDPMKPIAGANYARFLEYGRTK